MPSRDYPNDVDEVLDPPLRFKAATIHAVRAFAKSKPWRGTLEERQEKFRSLNQALSIAYTVQCPQLVFRGNGEGDSGRSCYIPMVDVIVMSGRLSVVTFLHEWGHRLSGASERKACRWSLNLFRKCFPKSWSRLRFDQHMARTDN